MSTPIAWIVAVTDGQVLRTLHPATFRPEARTAIERIVRDELFGAPPASAELAPPPPKVGPASDAMLTQRETAVAQGFTGDACTICGAFSMQRAGKCLTCTACGSTTGCS